MRIFLLFLSVVSFLFSCKPVQTQEESEIRSIADQTPLLTPENFAREMGKNALSLEAQVIDLKPRLLYRDQNIELMYPEKTKLYVSLSHGLPMLIKAYQIESSGRQGFVAKILKNMVTVHIPSITFDGEKRKCKIETDPELLGVPGFLLSQGVNAFVAPKLPNSLVELSKGINLEDVPGLAQNMVDLLRTRLVPPDVARPTNPIDAPIRDLWFQASMSPYADLKLDAGDVVLLLRKDKPLQLLVTTSGNYLSPKVESLVLQAPGLSGGQKNTASIVSSMAIAFLDHFEFKRGGNITAYVQTLVSKHTVKMHKQGNNFVVEPGPEGTVQRMIEEQIRKIAPRIIPTIRQYDNVLQGTSLMNSLGL